MARRICRASSTSSTWHSGCRSIPPGRKPSGTRQSLPIKPHSAHSRSSSCHHTAARSTGCAPTRTHSGPRSSPDALARPDHKPARSRRSASSSMSRTSPRSRPRPRPTHSHISHIKLYRPGIAADAAPSGAGGDLPSIEGDHTMARLSNQANLGYVPLPEAAAALIATYIQLPDQLSEQVRICDPCAGEGRALETICAALAIPQSQRYGCELHDTRATAARERIGHIVACDTLKAPHGSPDGFLIGYANPPFDHDGAEEGGGRPGLKFLQAIIEAGGWVQRGGLIIIVTPQDILARPAFVSHLAKSHNDPRGYALPDALRHFSHSAGVADPAPPLTPRVH